MKKYLQNTRVLEENQQCKEENVKITYNNA